MRLVELLLIVGVVSVAGCANLQHRLQYDNLDEVAFDATGKQLWEIEFGDQEIQQVRERLGRTASASLYCIRDNVDARVLAPAGLSDVQVLRRGGTTSACSWSEH